MLYIVLWELRRFHVILFLGNEVLSGHILYPGNKIFYCCICTWGIRHLTVVYFTWGIKCFHVEFWGMRC